MRRPGCKMRHLHQRCRFPARGTADVSTSARRARRMRPGHLWATSCRSCRLAAPFSAPSKGWTRSTPPPIFGPFLAVGQRAPWNEVNAGRVLDATAALTLAFTQVPSGRRGGIPLKAGVHDVGRRRRRRPCVNVWRRNICSSCLAACCGDAGSPRAAHGHGVPGILGSHIALGVCLWGDISGNTKDTTDASQRRQ